MKKITFLLMMIILFLISSLPMYSQFIKNGGEKSKDELSTRSMELPFCEDWNHGTFDFNDWTTSSENWEISSNNGNDAPSAQWNWDPDPGIDYSSSLTSQLFIADTLTEGKIWLDFDIALTNRHSTGDEFMKVEIYDGTNWNEVASFSNAEGSFDYVSNHIDISNHTLATEFKVRFIASGVNSFDVINWNVDNICVYRTCPAPENLSGEVYWISYDDYGAYICWEEEPPQASGTWISYVEGPYAGGIGLTDLLPITVAIQWDPEDLGAYNGMQFSKIRYYYGVAVVGTAVVQVWEDDNLILEEDAGAITANDWNEVTFSTPVTIDATKTYKLGYTVSGYDFGPDGPCGAQDFTGDLNSDLVYLDGAWDHLSNYLPYGWLIETFVSDPVSATPNHFEPIKSSIAMNRKGGMFKAVKTSAENRTHSMKAPPSTRSLDHFNIYKSFDYGDSYTFLTTVDAVDTITEYCYYDRNINGYDMLCYKVSAVYESDLDECESDFAQVIDDYFDYVCVLFTEGMRTHTGIPKVEVYPNPTKNQVIISSDKSIINIAVINYMGQLVKQKEINRNNKTVLNTSNFVSGAYLMRIETESGVAIKRILILK